MRQRREASSKEDIIEPDTRVRHQRSMPLGFSETPVKDNSVLSHLGCGEAVVFFHYQSFIIPWKMLPGALPQNPQMGVSCPQRMFWTGECQENLETWNISCRSDHSSM